MNNIFIDLLKKSGYEPRSYSGRGMYGEECLGVSAYDVESLFQDLLDHATDAESLAYLRTEKIFGKARSDSLGRGIIVYWPSIKWETSTVEE